MKVKEESEKVGLKLNIQGGGGRDGEHMQIHGWCISLYGKNPYNIVK